MVRRPQLSRRVIALGVVPAGGLAAAQQQQEYGGDVYPLTVMGEPSDTEPWGWQQSPVAREGRGGPPTRRHVHTVVRTPNGNDDGKDLLRQDYERFKNDPGHGHWR
ncbi:MAG: hypothetical protein FJW23_10810 [Acidimicrobiia bacterium]|nr:hypothetical protein [Acidimicrobiia bacterium]